MSASDLEQKLQAGIDAAQRGNRATARRLLEQVVTADPDNEIAWMWLASVSETLNERRTALQRVLRINPDNDRAREALRQLGGAVPDRNRENVEQLRRIQRGRTRTGQREAGGNISLPVLIGGALFGVLAVAGIIFLLSLGSQPPAPAPNITPTLIADVTDFALTAAAIPPTITPTPTQLRVTPRDPASIERNLTPLPPTPTSTPTPLGTATFTPSPTPFPMTDFVLFYVGFTPGEAQPSLYLSDGAGGNRELIDTGIIDAAIDPTGQKIVFVRLVDYGDEPRSAVQPETTTEAGESTPEAGSFVAENIYPELFVAPVSDLNAAQQITTLRSPNTGHPSWAPDSIQIAFSSDFDGDEEIYVITEDGQNLRQLTFNETVDRQPAWSPVPQSNLIVFVGGGVSAGILELYTISAQAAEGDKPTRLFESSGINYAPEWSPDGSLIVFLSDRGGDADVYLVNADGSDARLLTQDDGGAEDRAPTFTPDGRLVVFSSNRGDGSTFRPYSVDLRGREVLPLMDNLPEGQSILAMVFQPDIRFLVP